MPPKNKVYGRSKRKKWDDFCAAFQDLRLSAPAPVAELGIGEQLGTGVVVLTRKFFRRGGVGMRKRWEMRRLGL